MPAEGRSARELQLEASHTHLYPGARGIVSGALPAGDQAVVCEVAFSDGSVALGSLALSQKTEGLLETGPYTTAAGSEIPTKRWRLEISGDAAGPRRFRVRAKLPIAKT